MAEKINTTTESIKVAAKHIFRGFVWDILYFPVWLVTSGGKRIVMNAKSWIQDYAHRFALSLLAKSLLKPMFGQRDWQGRIISFFVRLVHLIILSTGWLVWSSIVIAITGVILLFPVCARGAMLYPFGVISNPPFYWFL